MIYALACTYARLLWSLMAAGFGLRVNRGAEQWLPLPFQPLEDSLEVKEHDHKENFTVGG